ncbi:SBBP repeat-containing protein [candidate division WOR-3 bacterium]|nr:SBBP repeat-containing protein [candidate division WOR-3 bacterium]
MKFCSLLSALCILAPLTLADPLWFRAYNGPDSAYDEVHAIGIDDSGNVIVSGYSTVADDDDEFVTIKYHPDGEMVWLRRFNPGAGLDGATALAVDRSGNVVVTGYLGGTTSQYGDWATVRYSAAGESLWATVHDEGDEDRASSVVTDSAGNSYVTGRAGWSNDLDYVVVKYGLNGSAVWIFRYNSGYNDGADAVALDAQGNTYVTGYASSGGKDFALLTWKLGPGGDSVWANLCAGPAGCDMQGKVVAADGQGNAVVAGRSYDTLTLDDYLTVKYGPRGDTLWTRRYNGPGNRSDEVAGLAVDGAGNVYVTGTSDVDAQGHYNYATVKYAPDGVQRWVARYRGPRDYDRACGLAVDADANVYVAGSSVNSGGDWDVVTIKYDSAGNEQWLERFDMPSMFDEAYVVALNSQGTVFVGGRTDNDSTGIDYLTLAYTSVSAVAAEPKVAVRTPRAGPTIIRGVLRTGDRGPKTGDRAGLLDVSGRKVMELHTGANDVSRLSPGVYFVHSSWADLPSSIDKVIVTR